MSTQTPTQMPAKTSHANRRETTRSVVLSLKSVALALAVMAALALSVTSVAAADRTTPSGYDLATVDRERAAIEKDARALEIQFKALNSLCRPPIVVPSRDAVNAAGDELDDARMILDDAELALKGPRAADKSNEYKKHEQALADAEARLDKAGKAIDKYAEAKAEAEKANDPLPHLTDKQIDAYEKAAAGVKQEQNWLTSSDEMAAFQKNLPALQQAHADAYLAWGRTARVYWEATEAYVQALRNAIAKALACPPATSSSGLALPSVPEIISVTPVGQGQGATGHDDGLEPPKTETPTPTPIPAEPKDSDGDGLKDDEEREAGTDPFDPDSDHEGISDGDEVHGYGTNPLNADTDGDGLDDGYELFGYLTDPFTADTDGDGATDGAEADAGTDPNDGRLYPGGDDDGDG
jgi:hypothetical protein